MKLIHLSDLHLGKKLNGFSLIEDQEYILTKIVNIIDNECPQGVMIAGDIYDKSVPSSEAMRLFDDFLYRLAIRKIKVFIISGNHDSPERMSFGSRIMDKSGIYIAPEYSGSVIPIRLEDKGVLVNIYMLPFVKPVHVKRFYENEDIRSYTDAVQCALSHMEINEEEINILITHQFVTGAQRSDSEELSVGGSDNVSPSVFSKFDYTALGHIHKAQNIAGGKVRYCGTPLKYSFSEMTHKKSVTVIEIGGKQDIKIRTVPLIPLRDMREVRGTYEELTLRSNYENCSRDDYIRAVLTDDMDVPHAIERLRVIYKNIMKLEYDNARTRATVNITEIENLKHKTETELFSEFYEKQNNSPMNKEQTDFVTELFERLRGELI